MSLVPLGTSTIIAVYVTTFPTIVSSVGILLVVYLAKHELAFVLYIDPTNGEMAYLRHVT